MDPSATIQLINDHGIDSRFRLECVQELANWLARGGFAPIGAPTIDLTYHMVEHDEDAYPIADLVAAINVAVAYGDMTGLAGLGFNII